MKFLKVAQHFFSQMGLSPLQTVQKYPFNIKNVISFGVLGAYATLSIPSLLLEANTFEEFVDSMYYVSSATCAALNFNILIWKMDKIFEFIGHFEDAIETRE